MDTSSEIKANACELYVVLKRRPEKKGKAGLISAEEPHPSSLKMNEVSESASTLIRVRRASPYVPLVLLRPPVHARRHHQACCLVNGFPADGT